MVAELGIPWAPRPPCKRRQASPTAAHGCPRQLGVILSQLLRGLVEKFRPTIEISAELWAQSREHADVLARQAVVRSD